MTSESRSATTRAYRKRLRAQQEAQTRRRITEAAVKLHGTVGPARTTIKGVADEAGVQRATVYRHFPTEESLFEACSSHWRSLNPPPDPAAGERTFRSHFEALRGSLLGGRPERGRARKRVAAAIGHALAFPTWRSLVS